MQLELLVAYYVLQLTLPCAAAVTLSPQFEKIASRATALPTKVIRKPRWPVSSEAARPLRPGAQDTVPLVAGLQLALLRTSVLVLFSATKQLEAMTT